MNNREQKLHREIGQMKERIEQLEKDVNNLAWGKAQHEDLVKLDDRVGKIEDCIDWGAARAMMNGVVDLPPLADSDFHETPKQRWMRKNLRPGEIYAGIMLGIYDYHLIVTTGVNSGLVPNSRELDLMRANLVSGKYIRRIPVE